MLRLLGSVTNGDARIKIERYIFSSSIKKSIDIELARNLLQIYNINHHCEIEKHGGYIDVIGMDGVIKARKYVFTKNIKG